MLPKPYYQSVVFCLTGLTRYHAANGRFCGKVYGRFAVCGIAARLHAFYCSFYLKSIAESQYSHSYSRARYSCSHTESRNSHHCSHCRRNRPRPTVQPFYFSYLNHFCGGRGERLASHPVFRAPRSARRSNSHRSHYIKRLPV